MVHLGVGVAQRSARHGLGLHAPLWHTLPLAQAGLPAPHSAWQRALKPGATTHLGVGSAQRVLAQGFGLHAPLWQSLPLGQAGLPAPHSASQRAVKSGATTHLGVGSAQRVAAQGEAWQVPSRHSFPPVQGKVEEHSVTSTHAAVKAAVTTHLAVALRLPQATAAHGSGLQAPPWQREPLGQGWSAEHSAWQAAAPSLTTHLGVGSRHFKAAQGSGGGLEQVMKHPSASFSHGQPSMHICGSRE